MESKTAKNSNYFVKTSIPVTNLFIQRCQNEFTVEIDAETASFEHRNVRIISWKRSNFYVKPSLEGLQKMSKRISCENKGRNSSVWVWKRSNYFVKMIKKFSVKPSLEGLHSPKMLNRISREIRGYKMVTFLAVLTIWRKKE